MIKHEFFVFVFYFWSGSNIWWDNDIVNPSKFSSKNEAYLYALMFSYIPGCRIYISDSIVCS